MRRLPFARLAAPRRGGIVFAAGVTFACGLALGTAFRLVPTPPVAVSPAVAAAPNSGEPPARNRISARFDRTLVYPADVVRVIDGDTFEARVPVWPGLQVDTKVRLRGIDAPELHARCSDELTKAQAARAALEAILGEGGVAISQVGVDKYGGRVDANASTRTTPDVSAAMLNGGWARSYDGGRRAPWC